MPREVFHRYMVESLKILIIQISLICTMQGMENKLLAPNYQFIIGPSDLCALHGTNCSLLMAFFLSSFSARGTFLPEGVVVGF